MFNVESKAEKRGDSRPAFPNYDEITVGLHKQRETLADGGLILASQSCVHTHLLFGIIALEARATGLVHVAGIPFPLAGHSVGRKCQDGDDGRFEELHARRGVGRW